MGELKEKIDNEIIKAISNVKTANQDEENFKNEYMMHVNKILEYYDELQPTLSKYINKRAWEKKFERDNER